MTAKFNLSHQTDKLQETFEYLQTTREEITMEVERLRNSVNETRMVIGTVNQNKSSRIQLTVSYPASTYLVTFLLAALHERNNQVDLLHKQVAASTKRLSEMSEHIRESDQKSMELGQVLNELFAEVNFPVHAYDQPVVESMIERVIKIVKCQKARKSRPRSRRLQSSKKHYGIK